jgi:hypothetical protein
MGCILEPPGLQTPWGTSGDMFQTGPPFFKQARPDRGDLVVTYAERADQLAADLLSEVDLVGHLFIPAIAAKAIRAATRAYSIRSCPLSSRQILAPMYPA